MPLSNLANLCREIRSAINDSLGDTWAKSLLRDLRMAVAWSKVILISICSNMYAEGKLDQWSDFSQWGLIRRAVRVLVSFTALYKLPLLDLTRKQWQVALRFSAAFLATWMGIMITSNALKLKARIGQKGHMLQVSTARISCSDDDLHCRA